MDIKKTAAKYGDYIIEMRRYFHQHPEVSTKEFETSKRIKQELDKMGVSWVKCGGETGVLATIKGAKPGKTILLRADMDALSVKEETGLPFASEVDGVMHACGHDAHVSLLLTAAHILNDVKDELCGTVKLAFQPAEETAQGAPMMIKDGALEGVDACFGIHVWVDVAAGKFSVEAGPRMASADEFIIDVKGKGGHGAAPHQCIDAAVVSSAIVSNLQTLVSREFDPLQPAVLTVGVMNVGSRWNVVPEYGHIEGTTRCFDKEVWGKWESVMGRIVEDTAKVFRAEAKLNYIKLVPPTINTPEMSAVAAGAVEKLFGKEAIATYDKTMGGEDFAFYLAERPGAIAFVGIGNEKCGAVHPHHSGKFVMDETALLGGAQLYAQVAADFNSQK